VSGAPEQETLGALLLSAGFSDVKVEVKEESRDVISQWLPGSGAEDFVISANISGRRPIL
tara:strand:- start:287 stop:466 length:180 start_codon:yes stop_codon:yes gene_type:complete